MAQKKRKKNHTVYFFVSLTVFPSSFGMQIKNSQIQNDAESSVELRKIVVLTTVRKVSGPPFFLQNIKKYQSALQPQEMSPQVV